MKILYAKRLPKNIFPRNTALTHQNDRTTYLDHQGWLYLVRKHYIVETNSMDASLSIPVYDGF